MDSQLEPAKVDARGKVRFALPVSKISIVLFMLFMQLARQEITENQGRRRPGTADERAHTHILSLSTYSSYTGLVSLYP